MSFNGSGTFVINTAGQPVVANTVISATVFNALTADLATGLSTCITKDGQTTITANIPFGSNKITGLGAATAATDAATLGQVQSTAAKLITVTGTDTITGTMSPALTAYAAGQLFYFIANAANTGAMTINIDGLGAKAITRDGSTALIAGDVNTGEIVVICYDGTRFQMINAANSFGNTTINGTLTVTGNTGLQANVSITSTLSVGGTFVVTGAATLGSTLSVTGKSDLPVVSTASMNAAVAVITTGTVTNLTSTSASIASMNAGVALLTNATVTTLTATGASIASANIGNLQFTAASIASINAGVAVITNLTATGASIASMNAGVALLTTATVTGLTATGASIASANAGNLQVTGASVASANVGVALITTGTVTALTATGASIGSANVGTAVVTGLTVTNASIASANAGTATLSGNLTLNGGTANGVLYLNGSKVATSGSAITFDGTNLALTGTAPIYKLPAAGGYLFDASGNTGLYVQQISSALLGFYTGGTEQMRLNSTGLGIGTSSPASKLHVSNTAAATRITITDDVAAGRSGYIESNYSDALVIGTTSGVRGIRFSPDNTPRMFLDTAGNLGIGTTSSQFSANKWLHVSGTSGITTVEASVLEGADNHRFAMFVNDTAGTLGFNTATSSGNYAGIQFDIESSTKMLLNRSGNLGLGVTPSASSVKTFEVGAVGNTLTGFGLGDVALMSNVYYDGAFKYAGSNLATRYRQQDGTHAWSIAASGTAGNTISFTQAMTLDASGNLGVGTTSPSSIFEVKSATPIITLNGTTNASARGLNFQGNGTLFGSITANYSTGEMKIASGASGLSNYYLTFFTDNTERARITSDGNFAVGATTASYKITSSVASGADRDMFLSGVTGVSNGVYWQWINSTSTIAFRVVNLPTTASAANAYLDDADGNRLYRSTSSIRYKKDVESVQSQYSENALNLRPVWYRSKAVNDNAKWSWYGLIAEEVAEIDPRLVHWSYAEEDYDVEDVNGEIKKTPKPDAKMIPDGVQYERLSVLLLDIVKKQNSRLEKLEAEVAALKGA